MLKIAGCILIFAGCTSLGFIKSSGYAARRRELENALELIRLLAVEITYRQDHLAKTFMKVSELKRCWFSDVLHSCSLCMKEQRPLADSWEAALSENAKNCPLH